MVRQRARSSRLDDIPTCSTDTLASCFFVNSTSSDRSRFQWSSTIAPYRGSISAAVACETLEKLQKDRLSLVLRCSPIPDSTKIPACLTTLAALHHDAAGPPRFPTTRLVNFRASRKMFATSPGTDSTFNRVSLSERLSRICSQIKSGSASVNQRQPACRSAHFPQNSPESAEGQSRLGHVPKLVWDVHPGLQAHYDSIKLETLCSSPLTNWRIPCP